MSTPQIGGLSRNPRTSRGRIARGSAPVTETMRSGAPAVGQETLLDIGAPDNNATYSVTVESADIPTQTIAVTTDGTATDVELGDLFAAAFAANGFISPILASIAREGSSSQDVRFRYRPGVATVTVTAALNPAAAVVVVNTPAVAGTVAPHGRFWRISDGASLGDNRILSPLVALAGPVATLDIGHGAGASYSATLLIDGQQVEIAWAAGANAGATATAAQAAAAAALPAGTGVVATVAGNDVTIAFPVGINVAVLALSAAGGGGSPTLAVPITPGGAVPQVALILDAGEVPQTIGGVPNAAPVGSTILALRSLHGEVGVQYPGAAFVHGAGCWVETAAGATSGRPFAVASPSRFRVPGAYWVRQDEVDSSTALLYVHTL